MDRSSLIGVLLGLLGILAGQYIEGGSVASLFHPAAMLIVLSGTTGAVLLQNSFEDFVASLKMARNVFINPKDDKADLANRIRVWSEHARKEGIMMLEDFIKRESEPFIKKGLFLMTDGTPPDKIREILAIDLYFYETKQRNRAKIWSAAGGYAPTIGILGAVLGLIQVMEHLSNPEKLGSGIAVAFVATIYGVALANLIFLPIANKMRLHIQEELKRREMLINAWVSIANGDHPKVVSERLDAYLQ